MNILPLAILLFAQLQGVVVKAGSGETLPNARVELRRMDVPQVSGYSTTAGGDGRFSFRNLAAGRYLLSATGSGYIATTAGRMITIDANRDTADIRIPVTLAGAIYGHVYDQGQRPLPNAEVTVMNVSFASGQRKLEPVRTQITNDLGAYRAFWLPPGRYYVTAMHPDGGRFQGPGGYMLSIRQAIITHTPENRSTANYVPIFPPGTADELDATAIDLGAGAEIGNVDITVFPVQQRIVRGTIVDATTGLPVPKAQLFVTRNPARSNDNPYIGVDSSGGAFEVSSILPGSYTFVAIAGALSRRLPVDILDKDLENLRITLTNGIDLQGRFMMENESPVPPGVGLSLQPEPEIPNMKRPGSPDNGAVSSNGEFTLLGVPAGEYRLQVTLPTNSKGLYVKSARLASIDVLRAGVRIDEPIAEPLEIVIGVNAGALEGGIVDSERQPTAGVTVVLIPGSDDRRRMDLYRTTTSDESGRFRLDELVPGDYKLFAWDQVDDGLWTDAEFLRIYEDSGTPVRIMEGRTINAERVLIPNDR